MCFLFHSCCVDEVTAQHYNADCIIHYGHACLSPTCRLPVRFVFGQSPVNVTDLLSKMKDTFTDNDQRIVLLYDTDYHHIAGMCKIFFFIVFIIFKYDGIIY